VVTPLDAFVSKATQLPTGQTWSMVEGSAEYVESGQTKDRGDSNQSSSQSLDCAYLFFEVHVMLSLSMNLLISQLVSKNVSDGGPPGHTSTNLTHLFATQ
jgi:hypothetical protein